MIIKPIIKLIHLPCTHVLYTCRRNLGNLNKFAKWYRNFWRPAPPMPPYSHVCQIGDPILRYEAEPVIQSEIHSDRIQKVVKKLKKVLYTYDSVGISAPQIGIPLKIFIIEFREDRKKEISPEIYKLRDMSTIPLQVFINPEMKVQNYEKLVFPEGCESVRGFAADVPRYKEVTVSGLNERGEAVSLQVAGWPARIVQHEMDHLIGRLYTDSMMRSSLACTAWHQVNVSGGKLHIPYTPKKKNYSFRN